LVLASDKKYKQLTELLKTKDSHLKQAEDLINEKDELIKYLQTQVNKINKDKTDEMQKVMQEQKKLKKEQFQQDNKDEQVVAEEFFKRFSSFLFKKKMTLYKVIHHKIFDKMINGVEMELITIDHFWRLLHKVGFKTVATERTAVNCLIKNKVLHEIFDVSSIMKILTRLGIVEDVPKDSDYDDLSGVGIRLINKIVREMKEQKISDVEQFLGKHNLESQKIGTGKKSETVTVINSDNFQSVLRKQGILKRWEDLDEHLQIFLSIPSTNFKVTEDYSGEKLMISKLGKCIQDFQKCEFFEYYGYEARNESDVDSEDEADKFNFFETIRNKLSSAMKANGKLAPDLFNLAGNSK